MAQRDAVSEIGPDAPARTVASRRERTPYIPTCVSVAWTTPENRTMLVSIMTPSRAEIIPTVLKPVVIEPNIATFCRKTGVSPELEEELGLLWRT